MRYRTIYHLRMKFSVNRPPFPQKCHFGAFPGVENNLFESLEDELIFCIKVATYGFNLVFDVYKAPYSRIHCTLCDLPHHLVLTICTVLLFCTWRTYFSHLRTKKSFTGQPSLTTWNILQLSFMITIPPPL